MRVLTLLKTILRIRELVLLLVVLLTGAVLWILSPSFATWSNLTSVAIGFAPEAVIAVGMTILIVSGGFDLSVGSLMALCGVIAGLVMKSGWGIALGMACGLALGAFCGLVNGLVVTQANVNPLIATLGMMSVARGISLVITQGYSVTDLPPALRFLGEGTLWVFPVSVTIMALLVLAGDIGLRKNRFLRQVYYIGGNERAARLSGIKVDQVRIFTYVLSGLLAAFGGIMLTARLMTATPMAGQNVELKTIAAVVIGGASLAGGEGTVLGGFLGIVFMALVSNALTLLDVSLYWHGVVLGGILIVAVSVDMALKKRR
jgi:ribose transport system permease protein